jgi:hypothetical protein
VTDYKNARCGKLLDKLILIVCINTKVVRKSYLLCAFIKMGLLFLKSSKAIWTETISRETRRINKQ